MKLSDVLHVTTTPSSVRGEGVRCGVHVTQHPRGRPGETGSVNQGRQKTSGRNAFEGGASNHPRTACPERCSVTPTQTCLWAPGHLEATCTCISLLWRVSDLPASALVLCPPVPTLLALVLTRISRPRRSSIMSSPLPGPPSTFVQPVNVCARAKLS